MDTSHDTEILQLDTFDAAFPLEPGREEDALRLFRTLFVECGQEHEGASGTIVRAHNYQGDVYALKTGKANDVVFHEEYRTLCSVACLRGFPDVFGFGTTASRAFIVMEWIEGDTLRAAMERLHTERGGALLPLPAIAQLGIAVCSLLSQANEAKAGFVHRDISPRNIMLRTDRHASADQLLTDKPDVCLVDFGSAAHIEEDPSFTKLSGILRYGTPDYAPPEMLTSDVCLEDTDRASETIDVYALCSVLYELYTGHTPYQLLRYPEKSPYRVKTEDPLPSCPPRDEDGGALAQIITSGLALLQPERPSRLELRHALENWLDNPRMKSPGARTARRTDKHNMWQPSFRQHQLTRRRFIGIGIVAAAAAVSGAIVASKAVRQASHAQADLTSLPVANALYTGEPLFKVNDGQHPGWALATAGGRIACKPQTSREIGPLREGVARCYSDIAQRYGFIVPNDDGSCAWKVLPQFALVGDFSDGLAAAEDPDTRLWGYIDSDGTWTLTPQYANARPFLNGLAAVVGNDSDGLWGAVNAHGEWVINPRFSALGVFSTQGIAVAQAASSDSQASSWGLVDSSGNWVCEPGFPQLRRFSEGCAPAQDAKKSRWGYVDAQGSWTIDPQFRDARPFNAGVAAVQDERTQLWYFITADGKPAKSMRPCFWKLGDLFDGLAPAQASADDAKLVFDDGSTAEGVQMRYGYVDASGRWHMKRLATLVDTAIGAPAI